MQPEQHPLHGTHPPDLLGHGSWQPAADCPFVCTNGTCTGTCRPGARRCGSTAVQACGNDGNWNDTESCRWGCDSGRTACRACSTREGQNCHNSDCQTGTYDCNENCNRRNKEGSCGTCRVCRNGSCTIDAGANCGSGASCVDSRTAKAQDRCQSDGSCRGDRRTCGTDQICIRGACGENDFANCSRDSECSSNTCIPVGTCAGRSRRCVTNDECGPDGCGGIPVCDSPGNPPGCSPACIDCGNRKMQCWPKNGV